MEISYVKLFNQVVDEFFCELIEIFPEETKIKVQYNLFQTLCKSNSKKVCTEFMDKVGVYLEKICMRDEEFFKGPDKPAFLNKMNFENIWGNMSHNTKVSVWNYIKSFIIIGSKVVQMPEEYMPLIDYISSK
jgi:hypothetical protein